MTTGKTILAVAVGVLLAGVIGGAATWALHKVVKK